MAIEWVELGGISSARDLDEGEKVTATVFDTELGTVLEQLTFAPVPGQTKQLVWVADFCLFINARSALIRAGSRSAKGEWSILESADKNKFWTFTTRKLTVVTTAPGESNWGTKNSVVLDYIDPMPSNMGIRVNVRNAAGACLETMTFAASANRRAAVQWLNDLAGHINRTSKLVRAGKQDGARIVPVEQRKLNLIFLPLNSSLSVTWTWDFLRAGIPITADRDAEVGERISLLVFDAKSDKLLDRITMIAKDGNRKKDQWPAELARQINASSGHVKVGNLGLANMQEELRTFTTSPNLANWVQADTLLARKDLKAADRVVVTVSTAGKGNFCEVLTFTPSAARLKAAQWAYDLAAHLNKHSLFLKAGIKNTTSKTIVPQESTTTNLIWMPADSGLKVSWDFSTLSDTGSIALERDLRAGEGCRVYVLDNTSEEILRQFLFRSADKRNTKDAARQDLAKFINEQTQLIVAGENKGDGVPVPSTGADLNTLWACKSNVRAFTSLHSVKNWEKGVLLGSRALQADEQVVVVVKGGKSGRIFETALFTPDPLRLGEAQWTKDCAVHFNSRSLFFRCGKANQTLFVLEASEATKVNYFWTPKGSGLVAEVFIISGVPRKFPGMSREMKEMFDQYGEGRKYISVDARTGLPSLKIPLAELFVDDSFSKTYQLYLSYESAQGIYVHMGECGYGGADLQQVADNTQFITLNSGRRVPLSNKSSVLNGGDFLLDMNVTKASRTCKICHRDGVLEEFFQVTEPVKTDTGNLSHDYRPAKFVMPSGVGVRFGVEKLGMPSKVSIGGSDLLKPEEIYDLREEDGKSYSRFFEIFLYPGKGGHERKLVFECINNDWYKNKLTIDGEEFYSVTKDSAGRLVSIDIERRHDSKVGDKTITDSVLHRETLEYNSEGKVSRHVISPGGGVDDLVYDYVYAGGSTKVIGCFRSSSPKTVFERRHVFSDENSYVEIYGNDTMPIRKENTHRVDTATKCIVSSNKVWEGNILVDEQSLTHDAVGTPVSRSQNGQVTRWTYYNNYQQFRVSEKEVHVEDTSFGGVLFKVLDYASLIGLMNYAVGGSSGITWGTRIDTTIEMDPAVNNYAKDAFNLPIEINHCGSARPLYGDMESELVYRLVDGKEQPERLTFFGYENVDGRVRMTRKLTILQPDYVEVDVTAQQHKIAKAAAQQLLDHFKDLQDNAKDAKLKEEGKQNLADLEKSLKAQSQVNGKGFKLKSRQNDAMTLETFTYHTDAKAAGYGTVKSSETVQLDQDGKELAASRRKTEFSYKETAGDTTSLTITTTISQGATKVVSSQTRSRYSGRLYESLDSEGIKTVYTYDPQGNMTSEIVSKDGKELRKTNCRLVRNLNRLCDVVENGGTTRLNLDIFGRKVREDINPTGAGWLFTRSWSYDSIGRCVSSKEHDIGKGNQRVATRTTTRVWDELTGKCTTTFTLLDSATNKETKVIQELTPNGKGQRFTQGKFTRDLQYNDSTRVQSEVFSSGSGTSCRVDRSFTKDGRPETIRYLTTDKAGKQTERDKVTYSYDNHGQLSKASPTLGAVSTYTYDPAGRLRTTTRDGMVLENTYEDGCRTPAAAKSTVKVGNDTKELGTQTVDLFGRVQSRTVAGAKTSFTYNGASRQGAVESPGAAPKPLADYTSKNDKAARTHTQTLGKGADAKSSILTFSTGGRVLAFTDLTKVTTSYEYDFFNRLLRSSNAHCESTFVYADNGLLTKETVKALKAPAVTMTVAYTYDELGQEIKRTFTCDGVDTLTLERTLLADGRLGKSAVKSSKTDKGKVVDTLLYTDSYEYDASLRLSKWTGWSSAQMDCFTADNTSNYTWTYDAFGNVIDRVGPAATTRSIFHCDAKKVGQLSHIYSLAAGVAIPATPPSGERTFDAAGRLTVDGPRMLSYHANGQANTYSMDKDKTKYEFSYDSEGRVRGGTQGNKSDTYHYRGDSVYALEQANGTGFTKRSLVLRNESRACLMQDAITDGKESRSFELRDANGTVIASVDLASKQINWLRYEPYGKRYGGSKAQTWLGFKGEPLMCDRVYYLGNGYRLYDATWGRFLTPDSLSPFGPGGVGRYVYGAGDPVNYHDPSGHEVVAQYSRWKGQPLMYTTAFRIAIGIVGVVIAPFTAGMSVLFAMATTFLAALSFALDVASIILAESDPQTAKTLEAWGQVVGIVGAAVGIGMTLDGFKGISKYLRMFQRRGGLPTPYPVKFPKTLEDIASAQKASTHALDRLAAGIDKAKATGTYDAFKTKYLNPGIDAVASLDDTIGVPLFKQVAKTGQNLWKGVVWHVDESWMDYLGHTLDMNSGPNVLVQKFVTNPNAETSFPIVGSLLPGGDKL